MSLFNCKTLCTLMIAGLLCSGCGTDDSPAANRASAAASSDTSSPSDGARPADALDDPTPTTASSKAPTTSSTTQAQTSSTDSTSAEPPAKLYGTWVANNVEAPMGQVKVQLTFKKEGPDKLMAWSELPLIGQVKDVSGPFEVTDDTIQSNAIRGGTTVKYRFDGDKLVIEYQDGSTVRFHRQ